LPLLPKEKEDNYRSIVETPCKCLNKQKEKEENMLESLDSIEWNILSHAYGEASDVPNLIRGLASADKKIRESSLWTLYTNIYHQGTVYQASAYAVPFLIELLKSEYVLDKDTILTLLGHLATGNAYLRQHRVI
jgi:hypothetical protein